MIKNFKEFIPNIKENVFIAENSAVIGNVNIDEESSVWYGAVLRGDMNEIIIGKKTNIQDNATVHVDSKFPLEIGDGVTVGHNCVIHGCKIEDNCLIGMGSTILDGAEIGENTIIGANSLVTQGKKIPSGVLCIGSPAKVVRELTKDEIDMIKHNGEHYAELAKEHDQK